MVCKYCGNPNQTKANYCRFCGKPFTDRDRQEAYDKTIFGMLDKLEDIKSWLDLSKITGNRIFRAAVLMVLLALVLVNIGRNGSHLAIQKSEDYTVAYNQEADEYYVLTEKEEISLNTYLPKTADTITVCAFENGVQTACIQETPGTEINLARTASGYYTLRADYADGSQEELLFFVCEEDAA